MKQLAFWIVVLRVVGGAWFPLWVLGWAWKHVSRNADQLLFIDEFIDRYRS
jgi:hypothetical protein